MSDAHSGVDIFEVNFVHNNDGKGDGEAPGFVVVVVVLYAASLDALKLVGSIRTASLTSVGNSRLLGSVVGCK